MATFRRGDEYSFDWRYDYPIPDVEAAMARHGWEDFHRRCGEIKVYFSNYRKARKTVTVQVYTVVGDLGTRWGPRRRRKIWLAEGMGRSAVAASLDGLRRSGGSSLLAWLAALHMAVAELEECVNARGAQRVRADPSTVAVAG